MIRDCRQAELVQDVVDFVNIVDMAADEVCDDEVGPAAVRQRVSGALEQGLRLVERELQAKCEGEDGLLRGMVVLVVLDF